MQNLDSIIEKLKELRTDITNGALIVEQETEFEELIKIRDIDDELYETLILIYTRNKNKLLTVKNDYTRNTIAIIDMNITILEAIIHKTHPAHPNENEHQDANNTQQVIHQPKVATPFTWNDLLNPNNVFKIVIGVIILLLVLWSMFLISPKATEDTVNAVNKTIDTVNNNTKK